MLEDMVRKGRLLDIYGPLLTERQHRCMELYFFMMVDQAKMDAQGLISLRAQLEEQRQRLNATKAQAQHENW